MPHAPHSYGISQSPFECVFLYTIGLPMSRSVHYPSQRSIPPTHRSMNEGELCEPGREVFTKNPYLSCIRVIERVSPPTALSYATAENLITNEAQGTDISVLVCSLLFCSIYYSVWRNNRRHWFPRVRTAGLRFSTCTG